MELAPQRYFHAVVVDYDGTIARSGVPCRDALAAIDEARAGRLRVILATGRILDELIEVFPDVAEHFDVIVAEDGTVLQRHGRQRRLAPPVPEELTEALDHEGIPYRRGHVALACRGEDDAAILAAVRRLGLDCQLVGNRSELMVLPPSCSKGTGTLAVGDAVESLKTHADLVLGPANGEGVAQLLRNGLGSGQWLMRPRRWTIELGRAADGTPAELPASHLGLLVTGGSGSGKSYMAGLITERLIAMAYSVLLIDPEGDHVELGQLPGVFVTGAQDQLADPAALARFLGHRLGSVVLDLSALDGDAERAQYLPPLPGALEVQHRRTGHPHWVIVDEAHTVLGEGHEQAVFVDRATTGPAGACASPTAADRPRTCATGTSTTTSGCPSSAASTSGGAPTRSPGRPPGASTGSPGSSRNATPRRFCTTAAVGISHDGSARCSANGTWPGRWRGSRAPWRAAGPERGRPEPCSCGPSPSRPGRPMTGRTGTGRMGTGPAPVRLRRTPSGSCLHRAGDPGGQLVMPPRPTRPRASSISPMCRRPCW